MITVTKVLGDLFGDWKQEESSGIYRPLEEGARVRQRFLADPSFDNFQFLEDRFREEGLGRVSLIDFLEKHYSNLNHHNKHWYLAKLHFGNQQMLQAGYELRRFLDKAPELTSSFRLMTAQFQLRILFNRRQVHSCIQLIKKMCADFGDLFETSHVVELNFLAALIHFFQRYDEAAVDGMIKNLSAIEQCDPDWHLLNNEQAKQLEHVKQYARKHLMKRLADILKMVVMKRNVK